MKNLLPLFILILVFSAQAFAVDFTVNQTTDQSDANLNDSACDLNLAATEITMHFAGSCAIVIH